MLYNSTYSKNDLYIAKVLTLILTFNMAVSFPASVFVSYITSQERFIFLKLANIGKTIAAPMFSYILLVFGWGSIGMSIATTTVSLLVDIINVCFCFSKLKMKIKIYHFDFRLLKDIFSFSIFIAINQIIDQINWQTDKIVLGKIVNGAAVAVYAVGAQVNNLFMHFSTSISGVFAPKIYRIARIDTDENNKHLSVLFTNIGRVQWFILALVFSGFVFFGKYFIKMWVGDDYGNAYYVALLLMGPAIIPYIQNAGIEIQRAKNKHRFRSIAYLIMAILNVAASIWLASLWQEIGTALGTAFSLIIANGLIMNIYYYKKLWIDVIYFWKNILKTIPVLLIPTITGIIFTKYFPIHNLIVFWVEVSVYSAVYIVSVYFLGLNSAEKNKINELFHRNAN